MHSHCGFRSFFQGGFECSSHYQEADRRLDLIASTCHDVWADHDYAMLAAHGLLTCRDGVRWHLIEEAARRYDFSSFLPMLRAARRNGVQVIWDLCHYGWPDGLDIFSPEFVDRFSRYSAAVVKLLTSESDETPYVCPMNEISFFSWAGAEMAIIGPFERGRGYELKKQLVRTTIASIEAIRDVAPHARFVQVDPVINIVTDPGTPPAMRAEALAYRNAQFQGWDMLAGIVAPELGGDARYLDIIGCNYYVHNQWVYGGRFIDRTDRRYRPLWRLLKDVWERYRKPLFIAETGIEEERRPEWFRYVCDEVLTAIESGVPVEGICLYPIVNHPGWVDDRHCHNGLWDYCNAAGHREIYIPLADELLLQQARFASAPIRTAAPQRMVGSFA